MRTLLRGSLVLGIVVLTGCSTFKGWFTPEGQRLSEARALASAGHPLGASALAVEALVLDPQYREALVVLFQSFEAGQAEFQSRVAEEDRASDPESWGRIVQAYRWQRVLADRGPGLGTLIDPRTTERPYPTTLVVAVDPVGPGLGHAEARASEAYWERARTLAARAPGPRQARLALAQGRVARGYATSDALEAWLAQTEAAATQKLLVVPFFAEAPWDLGPVSGPLASQVSRTLVATKLPELTSVFPSDRIATLPGGGLARLGIVSQPEAFELARAAGQNLVLLGQITRLIYQPPRKVVRTAPREKTVLVVDPAHPAGVEVTWKAVVTTTVWTSSARVGASFTLLEVDTGRTLLTANREVSRSTEKTETTFSGQREALTSEDQVALADKEWLDSDDLGREVLDELGRQIASEVVRGLEDLPPATR